MNSKLMFKSLTCRLVDVEILYRLHVAVFVVLMHIVCVGDERHCCCCCCCHFVPEPTKLHLTESLTEYDELLATVSGVDFGGSKQGFYLKQDLNTSCVTQEQLVDLGVVVMEV